MGKRVGKKKAEKGLNLRLTLVLFALIPMVVSAVIIGIVLIKTSSSELQNTTHNSLVSIIEGTGHAFDASVENTRSIMAAYSKAQIVTDALHNPEDADLAAQAQKYTEDFSEHLMDLRESTLQTGILL